MPLVEAVLLCRTGRSLHQIKEHELWSVERAALAVCDAASDSGVFVYLQYLSQVWAEFLHGWVQQLTDGSLSSTTEAVAITTQGTQHTHTSLQHTLLTVLQHDVTHLRQQQVQTLRDQRHRRSQTLVSLHLPLLYIFETSLLCIKHNKWSRYCMNHSYELINWEYTKHLTCFFFMVISGTSKKPKD